MAKSNKPIVWGPFAAGGTLTAFLTPVLVLLTLLAASARAVCRYDRCARSLRTGSAKLVLAGVIFLSLWSAAHRLRITATTSGVRADALVAATRCTRRRSPGTAAP